MLFILFPIAMGLAWAASENNWNLSPVYWMQRLGRLLVRVL